MNNDNIPNPTPSTPPSEQSPADWREQRREWRDERRAERREARHSGGWIAGLVLIVLGAAFLLQNTGLFYLQNWWALFILIPAAGSLSQAYGFYRMNGRLTRQARSALTSSLFMFAVAFVFLFNINLAFYWPLLLIAAGVLMLINTLLPD